MEMLKAENLTKAFDQSLVLKGISLLAQPGDVLLIIGKNGSGKTTLLRCLAQRLEADSGQLASNSPRIAFPSEDGFFNFLTIKENLLAFAALEGLSKRQAAQSLHELTEFFECGAMMNTFFSHCSRGQKQLSFILRCFINPKPGLYLFDEPYAHLDNSKSAAVSNMILKRAQAGSCIIMTGQVAIEHPQITVKHLKDGLIN